MMGKALIFSYLLVLAGCGPYPKDSQETLEKVQNQQVLRVGVIENRPWSYLNEEDPQGVEVEIILAFAKSLNVQSQWSVFPESQAIEKLKNYELDIVIGGLTQSSPWKTHVGFTRSYLTTGGSKKHQHVIAIPAGENRLLVTLEKFLKENKRLIKHHYQASGE